VAAADADRAEGGVRRAIQALAFLCLALAAVAAAAAAFGALVATALAVVLAALCVVTLQRLSTRTRR
jgi:hypothetical protein